MAEVTVSLEIKEILKKKLQETMLGLIPDEQLAVMIEEETKSFFELRQTNYLKTVNYYTRASAQRRNVPYSEIGNSYSKRPEDKVAVEELTMVTAMSPFRFIVWEYLGDLVRNKITANINDASSSINKQINEWFSEEAKANISDVTNVNFNNLSMQMAKAAQYETMHNALRITERVLEATVATVIPGNNIVTLETNKDYVRSILENHITNRTPL